MSTIYSRLSCIILLVFFSMGTVFADVQFPDLSEIKQGVNDGSQKVIKENKYEFIIKTPEEWPKEVQISGLKPVLGEKIETKLDQNNFYIEVPQKSLPPKYNDLYSASGYMWGPSITGLYGTHWQIQSETASIIVPVKYSYAISEKEMVIRKAKLEVSITFNRPRGSEKLLGQIVHSGNGTSPEEFRIQGPAPLHVKSDRPSIFRNDQLPTGPEDVLIENNAKSLPLKSVWLVRESKSVPGALTVTFYDKHPQSQTGFSNSVYILNKLDGWIFIGRNAPQEGSFISVNAASEKMSEMAPHLEGLYKKLQSEGFKKEGQIIP